MNFDHLNGRILAAHNNPLNPTGIANYVFEKTPEGFHHPYIGSIYCIDDPEMDYIKRRMVAAWNACQSLPLEALEGATITALARGDSEPVRRDDVLNEVTRQRDELLAIAETLTRARIRYPEGNHTDIDLLDEALDMAHAAITKITTTTP